MADATNREQALHSFGLEDKPPTKKARLSSKEPKARKTTVACAECRRRRIRCDGLGPPCGECSWYLVPHLCHYPARKQRSAGSFQGVSEPLDKARSILQKLFPSVSLDLLSAMSRQDLLRLAESPEGAKDDAFQRGIRDEDIQCLEPSPQQGFEWDESRRNQEVSDDVNGLSLALDSSSSYLGISSINAVLRVIVSISPSFPSWIQKKSTQEQPAYLAVTSEETSPPPNEPSLIDAFFKHIHCITPIVDEDDFRAKYTRGDNHETPWQALLNMILTMGSIATSVPDEKSHAIFYARAHKHLGLESFGSGHLETVQALGILGGYYCHYLNQPNMANVIMGAALRMAVAMGLHRESALVETEAAGLRHQVLREIRRRVWWSLFCLDTWASMLLGRPALGRWDPETITANLPSALSSSDNAGRSLRSSVEFCKIGTALQDRFARLPLMSCDEIQVVEQQVQQWEATLPSFLQRSSSSPPRLRLAQITMNMRSMNLRLVLHRPRLLTTSLRRARNGHVPPEEEIQVVEKCRSIARSIIAEIRTDWFANQLCVRNLNWFLFQACMVLLLSLFSEPNHKDALDWDNHINVALQVYSEGMSRWGLTVRRTREVVSMIYEASKASNSQADTYHNAGQDLGWDPSYMDTFWDPSSWSALPGFSDFNFDSTDFGVLGSDFVEFNGMDNFDI